MAVAGHGSSAATGMDQILSTVIRPTGNLLNPLTARVARAGGPR
jgi:hypothetical protein